MKMRIAEIMKPVETIEPGASLQQAAKRMRHLDVGSIPVRDGDRLVGMITDRDITIRATAAGLDPVSCRVDQAMTPRVDCCLANVDVKSAARFMQAKQIRRLPILDERRRLIGTVALGDLVAVLKAEDSGRALREISRRA
jgi:CBS domain-containing protein